MAAWLSLSALPYAALENGNKIVHLDSASLYLTACMWLADSH